MGVMGDERVANSQRRNQRNQTTTPGKVDQYVREVQTRVKQGKDTGQTQRTFETVEGAFNLDMDRTKDARNWEYWYNKERGNTAVEGTYTTWEGGKGGGEVRKSRQSQAIRNAERQANRDGQIQYEIDTLRAETKRLTKLTKYREEASTPFSSQKAAMGLRASQARSRRNSARGLGLRSRSYQRVQNLG